MAVQLDLTRDLPKVRKQYEKVVEALTTGFCDYTAPCVVGAMVPPSRRAKLQAHEYDECGDTSIKRLIAIKAVEVPSNQKRDFTRLQDAFDTCDKDHFERTLKKIEAKYLVAQVSA